MDNIDKKPTIPEVLPIAKAWYSKPGNGVGGMFHIILEDGNNEKHWAERALEQAQASGDADAIQLAKLLVAMSPTQRLKLSRMNLYPPN